MGSQRGAYRAATAFVGGRFRPSRNDRGRRVPVGDFRRKTRRVAGRRCYRTIDSPGLAVQQGPVTRETIQFRGLVVPHSYAA